MSTPPNDSNPQWGSPDAHGEQPGPAEPGPYGGVEPAPTGSKFGTSGYDPGASYNAPIAEPRQYSLLKTMTLAGLGLYLLSQIVGLLPFFGDEGRQLMVESVEATGQPVDASMIDGMVTGAIVFSVVLIAITLGLYLMVYFGLKKVRGWARVTGMVLAFIGLAFVLGGFVLGSTDMGSGAGMVATLLSVAWIAVTIYWLVLAFSSPVRGYMNQYRM